METVSKKVKTLWVISLVFAIIITIAEFFAALFSITSIVELADYTSEGWEGLGIAILFILSIIIMGGILVFSILTIIFSRISLKNNYHPTFSKVMIITPIIYNVLNIVLTILFLTAER